ncbi:MAG TPA: WYL domain-containing protein [Candidatus Egerieousia sp.]|nr:WYL domain-containing protein [Candidatus Egerieousia sp.]HPT06450.1 WYL domain-containing protein [Candidatus Egerieousia sp.]
MKRPDIKAIKENIKSTAKKNGNDIEMMDGKSLREYISKLNGGDGSDEEENERAWKAGKAGRAERAVKVEKVGKEKWDMHKNGNSGTKKAENRVGQETSKTPAAELFLKYVWLVQLLMNKGGITFEDIDKEWQEQDDLNPNHDPMPLRTFNNHRIAIERMFGVSVKCNRRDNTYSIEDSDEIMKPGLKSWLLTSLTVNHLINKNQKIRDRILFEDVPGGQKYMPMIMNSMNKNTALEMKYQSFNNEEAFTATVNPLCIKVFKQRWYMLAYNTYVDGNRLYALDRIKDLQYTKIKFSVQIGFDAQAYFANTIGVSVLPDEKPQIIHLKVNADQCKYFDTLPLHFSQKKIESRDSYSIYEYCLSNSYELMQEVISHGADVEVISPAYIRDKVKVWVKELCDMYLK